VDDGDALPGDVVLARAEQHEVAAQELGHRLEVGHHLADGDERVADGVLDLLELLVVQPPREVEVHDRLAVRRVARAADAGDPALAVALHADHGVQQPDDLEPVRLERARNRVDQERPVVGVGLHDRAERLVAVLGERGVERAYGDRLGAASGREVERADDLGQQVLGRDARGRVAGQPPQVRVRERADGVRALGRNPFSDQCLQPAGRR
jgi:hypothetical protein